MVFLFAENSNNIEDNRARQIGLSINGPSRRSAPIMPLNFARQLGDMQKNNLRLPSIITHDKLFYNDNDFNHYKKHIPIVLHAPRVTKT